MLYFKLLCYTWFKTDLFLFKLFNTSLAMIKMNMFSVCLTLAFVGAAMSLQCYSCTTMSTWDEDSDMKAIIDQQKKTGSEYSRLSPPPLQYGIRPSQCRPPPNIYRLPPNTACLLTPPLLIPPPSQYRLPPNIYRPSQYRLSPNTAAQIGFFKELRLYSLPIYTAVSE